MVGGSRTSIGDAQMKLIGIRHDELGNPAGHRARRRVASFYAGIDPNKKSFIPRMSSLLTAAVLYSFAGVYWSYGLWFSLVSGLTVAVAWTLIFLYAEQK